MGGQAFDGLAVGFGVGVDEIVERGTFLLGREDEVAAVGEEDAIVVVGAEEVVALGGIFPGFAGIDGNPADAVQIKFGPAVVAGDVAFGFSLGKREADFKARGNSRRAHHADK